MKIWLVDDGEQHYYAAETMERARAMYLEPFISPFPGKLQEDYLPCKLDDLKISVVADDVILSIFDEVTMKEIKKPAALWAAGFECLICTSAW